MQRQSIFAPSGGAKFTDRRVWPAGASLRCLPELVCGGLGAQINILRPFDFAFAPFLTSRRSTFCPKEPRGATTAFSLGPLDRESLLWGRLCLVADLLERKFAQTHKQTAAKQDKRGPSLD